MMGVTSENVMMPAMMSRGSENFTPKSPRSAHARMSTVIPAKTMKSMNSMTPPTIDRNSRQSIDTWIVPQDCHESVLRLSRRVLPVQEVFAMCLGHTQQEGGRCGSASLFG